MFFLTFICSIAILYFKNIAYFLICIALWFITISENKKFKNDMRLYGIVESDSENLKNVSVLMNK